MRMRVCVCVCVCVFSSLSSSFVVREIFKCVIFRVFWFLVVTGGNNVNGVIDSFSNALQSCIKDHAYNDL